MENIATLGEGDVLKFVVGSVADLHETERVVSNLSSMRERPAGGLPHIFVSPVFGTLPNETIVDWMLDSETMTRNGARFQVQLHKIVWDPERRGV